MTGIRGRLYRHARGRGNRFIAAEVAGGASLYLSYIEGMDSAAYEALYLHLQTGFHFPYNRRSELTRYLQALAEMRYSPGVDPFQAWDSGTAQH